jgi:hypothetical protein
MDTSDEATAARLRRVYACKSSDEVCKVYGVRKWDAGAWHREQDERALARAYLAEHPPEVPTAERGLGPLAEADRRQWELMMLGLVRQLPRDNPVRRKAEQFLHDHGDGPLASLRDDGHNPPTFSEDSATGDEPCPAQ